MTEEMKTLTDRVERIESRADGIETRFLSELRAIHEKLNQLAISAAARRDCPSPGLCVALQERLRDAEIWIKEDSKSISSLEKWQAWMMGAMVIIGALITLFGPLVRHVFNLPN